MTRGTLLAIAGLAGAIASVLAGIARGPGSFLLAAPQQPGVQPWSFEDTAPGGLPAGVSAETGIWAVALDGGAPSGRAVLAQQAASPDDVFNLALFRETRYADVDVRVRLRAVAGSTDQGGGVAWRAQDARNYYIARWNPLEDNFRVYVVVDSRRRMLQSVDVNADRTSWHEMHVTMIGASVVCVLDDHDHLDAQDSTFAGAGMVGLWTKADARTHFDDLVVSPAAW